MSETVYSRNMKEYIKGEGGWENVQRGETNQ